ncbi:DUF5615 family PIN-like protein [Microcoleus sp. FACHB-SPT15]|uniref:DUF5615 family PIN-like protein n=1 Tax=Microcoleus sp. FACHB-SPT15 TaxID=2692830 RepID=UPI001F5556D8|nr:DUF5615 family PIN-like protein [Microcoleus sp. FACHB-SPT15]
MRNASLNVVTVADAGRLGYPDEDQLIWATEQGRVIYSFNIGDFCRLHRGFMHFVFCYKTIQIGILKVQQ